MKYPKIDETKLPIVKEIIDRINYFAVEENCDEESPELKELARKLREVTGNEGLGIEPFMYYDSCTTLDNAAMAALLPVPRKTGLSDEEIREIIGKIINAEIVVSDGEAMHDYFLKVLEVETGLDNISDYIYYPDLMGLEDNAEEIIKKILADKK